MAFYLYNGFHKKHEVMRCRKNNIKCCLILTLLLALLVPAQAQSASIAKYQALFTMRFIKYVNWPSNTKQYTIGVVGANSYVLNQLTRQSKGRMVNGKPVKVSKIYSYSGLDKYNIIFIPSNQSYKFERIKRLVAGKPVLIVTENSALASKGAGISFYTENSKLKFRLNKSAFSKGKMTVSPRLLAVAKVL
jgi:hypothetical protein